MFLRRHDDVVVTKRWKWMLREQDEEKNKNSINFPTFWQRCQRELHFSGLSCRSIIFSKKSVPEVFLAMKFAWNLMIFAVQMYPDQTQIEFIAKNCWNYDNLQSKSWHDSQMSSFEIPLKFCFHKNGKNDFNYFRREWAKKKSFGKIVDVVWICFLFHENKNELESFSCSVPPSCSELNEDTHLFYLFYHEHGYHVDNETELKYLSQSELLWYALGIFTC